MFYDFNFQKKNNVVKLAMHLSYNEFDRHILVDEYISVKVLFYDSNEIEITLYTNDNRCLKQYNKKNV